MATKGSPNSGKKRGGASSSSLVVLHADSTPDLVNDLNPHDILLGRGAANAFNEGNVAFRRLIGPYKAIYMGTSRHNKKQAVAVDILNQVHQLGGRFLKEVRARRGRDVSKAWVEVSEEDALEKVKQALRERDALSDVSQDQPAEAAVMATVASLNDDHSDDSEDYTGDEQEEDRKPAAVATVSHTPLPPPPPLERESGGTTTLVAESSLEQQPTTALSLPYAHAAFGVAGMPFPASAASVTALGQQLPGTLATAAPPTASLVGQSDTGSLGRSMTANVLGQLDETRRRIQVLANQQRITAVELHLLVQRQQQENVQLALLQQQEQRQQQSLTMALSVWGSGAAAAAAPPPLSVATATTTAPAAAAPAANPSADDGASGAQQQLAPGATNSGNNSNS